MVAGNHFGNQVTVVVNDGHFSRMIVEKILRGFGIQQEVFVHELFHNVLLF
jgi:hypothetical protein